VTRLCDSNIAVGAASDSGRSEVVVANKANADLEDGNYWRQPLLRRGWCIKKRKVDKAKFLDLVPMERDFQEKAIE